jgi:broad specificity phosphatase PhoE
MTLFLLVRHGQTVWNAERRMQGRSDSALTAHGRAQAAQSGALIARLGFDAAFASPLGRVRETAAIMAAHGPFAPMFDERLQEWDCGAWSGRLVDDVERTDPTGIEGWRGGDWEFRPPGGESFSDVVARARNFLADAPAVQRIVIAAHGVMNRALTAALLDLTPEDIRGMAVLNDTVLAIDASAKKATRYERGEGPFAGLPPRGPAAPVSV